MFFEEGCKNPEGLTPDCRISKSKILQLVKRQTGK